ncbi:phage tail protein [Kitasatospora sp. NPDC051853]|uniref:phage tail protein n=1 Tax=Kitasatospora sp. NPDC051853 TaxID=3364058 RepID=UPI00378AEE3A
MALPDMDTSVGHSFGLECDGVVIKQIGEVSGLTAEQDVIELKQNTADGTYVTKKLPGRPKAGEVTLTRSLTADNSFEKWVKDSRFGKVNPARKGCAIIVFDHEGNPVKRYVLVNAWPKSLETVPLEAGDAGDAGVLTEKIVITYEQMDAD